MRRNSCPVMLIGLLHRGKLVNGSQLALRMGGPRASHSPHSLRSVHAVGPA